jgi:hypothetical protein
MKTNILVTRTMEVVPWSRPTQNRPLTWDDFMVHSVNRPLEYSCHEPSTLKRIFVLLNEPSSWLNLHHFDESCEHVNSFCLRMFMEYTITSVIPFPLLYPQNSRERMCLVYISVLVVIFIFSISWVLTLD